MNINEFRKQNPKKGDTLVLLGRDTFELSEKTCIVKEINDYGHWIHIIDEKNFNYTHKDIIDIVKE